MRIIVILMTVTMLLAAGCALNKDVQNIEQRISRLETENKSLQNQIRQIKADIESQIVAKNNLREAYAAQEAEFYDFKEKTRQLNGRLDEIEHRINRDVQGVSDSVKNISATVGHFTKTVSENKDRIQRIEHFVGFEPGGVSTAKKGGAPAGDKNLSEDELYQASKQAYDRADYETARQGFTKFLELYPTSDKADNARFWIGEIYFSEQWYQKAILEYQQVIENYPNGNKVPSAYLKQGLAFHNIGEDANALLVFKTLIEKFPDSNEAVIARQKVGQIE